MVQHHKWSMTEIEDMMPYERDIYMAMLSKWVDHEGNEHRVKEDYDRNRELIDLSKQPDHIKEIISSTIKSATSTPKNSTQVGVYLMKFCHLFDLQKIKDLAGQYAAPLNGRYGT